MCWALPCETQQGQKDDDDHDFQVWDSFCRFLFGSTTSVCYSTGCCYSAALAVPCSGCRHGFCVPSPDASAVMAWRKPAVRAEFPPAVLAGEWKDALIAAIVAAGHITSFWRGRLIIRSMRNCLIRHHDCNSGNLNEKTVIPFFRMSYLSPHSFGIAQNRINPFALSHRLYGMGRYAEGDVLLASVALDDRILPKARPVVVIRAGDRYRQGSYLSGQQQTALRFILPPALHR